MGSKTIGFSFEGQNFGAPKAVKNCLHLKWGCKISLGPNDILGEVFNIGGGGENILSPPIFFIGGRSPLCPPPGICIPDIIYTMSYNSLTRQFFVSQALYLTVLLTLSGVAFR